MVEQIRAYADDVDLLIGVINVRPSATRSYHFPEPPPFGAAVTNGSRVWTRIDESSPPFGPLFLDKTARPAVAAIPWLHLLWQEKTLMLYQRSQYEIDCEAMGLPYVPEGS